MKRKLSLLAMLLLVAGIVYAVVPATIHVGDTTFQPYRIGSAHACKVYSISGYNSGAAQFIMVFEATVAPTNGQTGAFCIPVGAQQFYNYDFSYYGADLTGVVACNSTTAQTNTFGSTNCSFQFIISSQ